MMPYINKKNNMPQLILLHLSICLSNWVLMKIKWVPSSVDIHHATCWIVGHKQLNILTSQKNFQKTPVIGVVLAVRSYHICF